MRPSTPATPRRLNLLLEPMHGADIADIIERLTPAHRRSFMQLYSGEFDGEILSEIDESIREEVMDLLPRHVLAEAVREMDSDDVVDLIEDLDEPDRAEILAALDESDRAAVQQALAYPEYSAGRLMQSEVVTAPEHWTVGEAIDFLRGRGLAARPVLPHHSGRSAPPARWATSRWAGSWPRSATPRCAT